MLIVDDILCFPVRGIFWIFRELQKATEQEVFQEAEAITTELSELYMMLETGMITEDEFDTREKELLDRLEELEDQGGRIEDEPAEQSLDDEWDGEME